MTLSLRAVHAPLAVALLASVAVGACGGSGVTRVTRPLAPPPADGANAPPPVAPFALAAGDLLAIQFPYRPELDQELLVRSDGKVTLPFVGTVDVAGRTPEQVEADARRRYAERAYSPLRQASDDRRYRIAVDDQLSVRFRRAPELNAAVRVRPDGRISLPLVRSLAVEGMTPEELEEELVRRYAAHLEQPELVVALEEPASTRLYAAGGGDAGARTLRDVDSASISLRSMAPRQVFVAGEVRAAGFVTHQPALTVLQSVVAAGGPLRTAKLDHVVVLRRAEGGGTATIVNLAADIHGRAANDFALQPFDIVIVPKTRVGVVGDFLDQYVFQLVPASRNVNFTYFYDLGGRPRP